MDSKVNAPRIAVVDRRGAVEGDTLPVHVVPQQRHVILPADDSADFAEAGLEDGEGRAVAEAPDEALHRGGHQLAMLAREPAVG